MRKWMTRGLLTAAVVAGGIGVGGTAMAAAPETAVPEAAWVTMNSSHPDRMSCELEGYKGEWNGIWADHACVEWPNGVWRLWVVYDV